MYSNLRNFPRVMLSLRRFHLPVQRCVRCKSSLAATPSLVYSRAVKSALENSLPLVALESTIITHGMPYPENIKTALSVEKVIKDNGAVPATVAILDGRVHIGLEESELEFLASGKSSAIKTSRRDMPFVLSQGRNGGTTVSGTMMAAHWAGISVFVTGGIGGVHRGAESSMDISADLTELGRTPIAVISAGVKSILDIGRTLEYLETEGVFVASFSDTKDFPSFFTAKSGHQAPYNVNSALQAAQVIDSNLKHKLGSGMLFAVPIPEKYSAEGALIDDAIQQALLMASEKNITGKEVTPYILDKVNSITGGRSLKANVALVENNAKVGAQIACELAKLQNGGGLPSGKHGNSSEPSLPSSSSSSGKPSNSSSRKRRTTFEARPVVVGAINVDFTTRFATDDVQSNGATYRGTITTSLGGVGRNIADCLSRLGTKPRFISTMGQDSHAEVVLRSCTHMDLSAVTQFADHSTATYCAILKNSGELIYGIGDFRYTTNKSLVEKYESDLSTAPLVVMDGNITADAMNYITEVCSHHQVPVWFEPTDISQVSKLFSGDTWQNVTYTSPNMNELRSLAAHLKGEPHVLHNKSEVEDSEEETILEAFELSKILIEHIPVVMVTMGKHGVLLCNRDDITGPLPTKGWISKASGDMVARHYPSKIDERDGQKIVSVSGAGDCIASGVIMSSLNSESPDWGMRVGMACAHRSMKSHKAIPETITPHLLIEGKTSKLTGKLVEFPSSKINSERKRA